MKKVLPIIALAISLTLSLYSKEKKRFSNFYFPLNVSGVPIPIVLTNPATPPLNSSPYGCDDDWTTYCAAAYNGYSIEAIDATHNRYTAVGTQVVGTITFKFP